MKAGARRATRERILEVAETYLGERGYHGTRLHEIARRVGVQKASLFHYFPSKAELYRAVVEEGFGETEAVIRAVLEREGNRRDKIRALIESYVDLVAVHPARTRILLRQSLGDAPTSAPPAGSQRLLERVVAFIADGQRAGVFAPVDPLALVLGVAGMVAFFFTSGPVLAPVWIGDPTSAGAIERVKRHVVEMVQRCLAVGAELRAGVQEYAAL
jgi:AcrR family transcriptional regulator